MIANSRTLTHTRHCVRYGYGRESELQSNQLSGTIPSTLGSLVNLQALYVKHLSEVAVSSIAHSMYLIRIIMNSELQSNQLSGTIPSTLGSLVNLQYLYVKHLSEMASSSIAHLLCLIELCNGRNLNSNQLNGTIPSTVGSLTNLVYLYDTISISYLAFIVSLIGFVIFHYISTLSLH